MLKVATLKVVGIVEGVDAGAEATPPGRASASPKRTISITVAETAARMVRPQTFQRKGCLPFIAGDIIPPPVGFFKKKGTAYEKAGPSRWAGFGGGTVVLLPPSPLKGGDGAHSAEQHQRPGLRDRAG